MKLALYSALFAGALTCASGYAQPLDAQANVPFSFRIGDTVLPAGAYRINETRDLLRVSQMEGKESLFHLVMPASRSTVTPDSRLRFTRYGDEYFLTSIWNADSSEGFALTPSRRQKALAMHLRGRETPGVALLPATR